MSPPKFKLPAGWRGPYSAMPKGGPKFKPVKPGAKWQRRLGAKPGAPKYVLAARKPKAAPKPKPTAPKIPYSEYAAYPFAQRQLVDIDRAEESHRAYGAEKVAPWLAGSLRALTGVDPAAPGYNAAAQQQYLANVAGTVGGALNAAATATPMTPGATTPGAVVSGPLGFLGDAARTAAAQRSSAALVGAQAQQMLNTIVPNTLGQGAVMALSDRLAGLPGLYAQKRSEARGKIDQFILEFEEANRRARVNEAINAMQAQGNLALGLGQLGLSADDNALDLLKFNADANAATAESSAPVPFGFVRLPNGNIVRDPQVPTARAPGPGGGRGGGGADAGTSTRDARGRLLVPSLQERGFRRSGSRTKPKVPAGWKVVQGADNRWWVLRPATSGGSAPRAKGTPAFDLQKKLTSAYDDGLISDDQNEGTGDLLRFLRQHQPAGKDKAWVAWFDGTLGVLRRVDPDYYQWIAGWVKRRKADGTWKGRF